jgi:hypothetical protein
MKIIGLNLLKPCRCGSSCLRKLSDPHGNGPRLASVICLDCKTKSAGHELAQERAIQVTVEKWNAGKFFLPLRFR